MQQQLTTQQLAKATGVGPERLAQLEKAGVIKRSGRNRWPAIETLGALVLHYRSEARRGHRSAADAELRRARAKEIEVRTLEREHKLVPTTEAIATLDDITGVILTGLSALPTRVAGRDLQLRRKVEDELLELRTAVSERLQEQGEALCRAGAPVTTPPRGAPR
jgi:hypothetical protein